MKGFVYLLEIAVASILMVVVLSTFFAIRVKQDWDSSDLVGVGNNILNYIRQNDSLFLNVLNEDFTQIEKIKPVNVGYGLRVMGSPKTNITVGCAQPALYDYINDMLTDAHLNGRSIDFHVETFDMNEGVPEFMDALVLVNFTDYSTYRPAIESYLNSGGIVIGMNGTYDNSNTDFNEIFGLADTSPATGTNRFEPYNPTTEDLELYFMGIGFDVENEWDIWGEEWNVEYLGEGINITNSDGSAYVEVEEGEEFSLPGHGSYSFKVKGMFSDNSASIQPLNRDFAFDDFSDANDVVALNERLVGTGGIASMTANGSAIWISDFPAGQEYVSLVKSAIISRMDNWVAKGVYTTREVTTVSSFFSLCCDMPEISELEITLWYSI